MKVRLVLLCTALGSLAALVGGGSLALVQADRSRVAGR